MRSSQAANGQATVENLIGEEHALLLIPTADRRRREHERLREIEGQLDQAAVAVAADVEHLAPSVAFVGEVDEPRAEHGKLVAHALERHRLRVAARLRNHDAGLVGELAAGRVQEADPAVTAPVDDDVLAGLLVPEEQDPSCRGG